MCYRKNPVTGQQKPVSSAVNKGKEVAYDLADAAQRLFKNNKYDFSFRDPRFIERYLQEKLWILVHARLFGINGDCVACFQRESIPEGQSGVTVDASDALGQELRRAAAEGRVDERKGCASGHQKAMLVDNVEAVESPQGIIPSLVWLDSLDRIYGVLPHALYLSRKSGVLLLGERFTLADWETDVLGRLGLSRHSDEPTREVIKSASQVLNRVSSNHAEMCWNRSHFCDCINSLSSLRISLYDSAIGVSSREVVSGSPEIIDVLIGPVDF